jgi:hypothetical protein
MKKLFVLSFLLVAFIATLCAAKLVSPIMEDGSYDPTRTFVDYSDYAGSRAEINVPGDYATISEAIAAAQPNDTVHINAGSYTSTALMIDKPLTIEGAGSNTIIEFTDYVTATPDNKKAVIWVNYVGPTNYVNFYNMQITVTEDIGIQGSAGSAIHINETSCNMDGLVVDFNEWVWSGIYSKDMNSEHDTEFNATNCSITGVLKNGITGNGPGLSVTMTGNTVFGPTIPCPVYTGNIAGNGLQIGHGATGLLSNNIIYDFYSDDATYGACGLLAYNTGFDTPDRFIEMSNNSVYDCEMAICAAEDYELTITMNNNNTYWTELKINPVDDDVFSPAGFELMRYMHVTDQSFQANLTNNNIVRYPACDSMLVDGYTIGGGEAFQWGGSYVGDGPISVNLNSTTMSGVDNAFFVAPATGLIEVNFDEVDFVLNEGYGVQIYSWAGLETINAAVNFTNSTFTCIDPDAVLIDNYLELNNFANIVLNNNDFSNFAGTIISNGATGTINADYNYWGVNDPTTKVVGTVNVSPWYTDAAMTNLAHPAAQNVTVSKSGTDVTLNWEAWGVSETYEIYKTTGNPYISTGWTNVGTGISTTQTVLSDQTEAYAFYRVNLTGEVDYVENDVVGYYTVNCDINAANTNLNFISVPFSTSYTNASDYVENVIGLTNCNTISKWVDSAQAWQTATYVSELSIWFGDFAIEENGAYLMGCNTDDFSYIVSGYLPVRPEYTLVTGNNLIMVPMDVAASTDSGTFYDDEFDLESGDTIGFWDFVNQAYITYSYSDGMGWENNFTVNPGDPVMAGE